MDAPRLRIVPATLEHMFQHLIAKNCPLPEPEYRALIAEVVDGSVMAAIDDGGNPVALGGLLVPDAGGPVTAWFSVVPLSLRRSLVSLVRLLRVVLQRTDDAAAYVRDDNPAGQRLARALGFERTETMAGSLRQWRRHVRHVERPNLTETIRAGAGSAGAASGVDR